MLKKATIYWIRYDDYKDPFTEGYIGVTVNPEIRFKSHRTNQSRPQIFNRIESGAKIEIIHDELSEETKVKISVSHIGIRPTIKSRQKMPVSQMRRFAKYKSD